MEKVEQREYCFGSVSYLLLKFMKGIPEISEASLTAELHDSYS